MSGAEPVQGGEQESIRFRVLGEPLRDSRAVLIDTAILTEPPIELVVDHRVPASADRAPAGNLIPEMFGPRG